VKVAPSPTRLKVYFLLVDEQDGMLPQKEISNRLGISKTTVAGHVHELRVNHYVKELKGREGATSAVKFYVKGANAHILDMLCLERRVRDAVRASGGSAAASSGSGCSAETSNIIEFREHSNGAVYFNVIKEGDLHRLCVCEPGKVAYEVPLFDEQPIIFGKKGKGSTCYQGKVGYRGEAVTVQYWRGKNGKKTLAVWGPFCKKVTADHLPDTQADLKRVVESFAQDIANYLSKHGGWRFSLGQFKGQVELATDDPSVLAAVPEDDRRRQRLEDSWFDESGGKGQREWETASPTTAKALANIGKTTKVVYETARRVDALEVDSCRRREVDDALANAIEANAKALRALRKSLHSDGNDDIREAQDELPTKDSSPRSNGQDEGSMMYR